MSKPPVPTRPGPWALMWHNFWESFSRVSERKFVGEDSAGNRFYEYLEGQRKGNIQRGFEPPTGVGDPPQPSVEWRAWLNKTRRFPPSEEELRLNTIKQQAQLQQNEQTEKKAPTIVSTGVGAADMDKRQNLAANEFPKYAEEFEQIPGVKSKEQLKKEEGERKYKKFFFER